MSSTTGIQWTDATWNPWYGCRKVSPGCAHCYMFREMRRYGRDPGTITRSKTTFRAPLKWAADPAGPRRVFACSWSDWFIEQADGWRAEAWEIVRTTPQITYQLLTKRPERILSCLPPDWGAGYPNVVLMTSVEDQGVARVRLPLLCAVPAAMRGISCEPLLGRVDLTEWIFRFTCGHASRALCDETCAYERRLHWVIAGGESGGDARPSHPDWFRSLREQCLDTATPFFFKQWGEWLPFPECTLTDAELVQMQTALVPSHGYVADRGKDVSVYRVGKSAAGRLLDGREWNEFPEVR